MQLTNIVLIGYTAWKGFLKLGRGAVFCCIQEDNLPGKLDEILNLKFFTKSQLEIYLHELILAPKSIPSILQAVDSYNPQTDLILLLQFDSKFEVNILQNLSISPPVCYQQVSQRWEEFHPQM
ncbi:hypothetical protein [Calothrix sp. 336/3]|uniref:hypothetical protein n=1 Tax=Calothrix sp. 336/3 TaxID=1337936 RepID=UPI0011874786|nr:hypothetical protein [Calothrix sp. 336/3]